MRCSRSKSFFLETSESTGSRTRFRGASVRSILGDGTEAYCRLVCGRTGTMPARGLLRDEACTARRKQAAQLMRLADIAQSRKKQEDEQTMIIIVTDQLNNCIVYNGSLLRIVRMFSLTRHSRALKRKLSWTLHNEVGMWAGLILSAALDRDIPPPIPLSFLEANAAAPSASLLRLQPIRGLTLTAISVPLHFQPKETDATKKWPKASSSLEPLICYPLIHHHSLSFSISLSLNALTDSFSNLLQR